jgi:hypothetical protein
VWSKTPKHVPESEPLGGAALEGHALRKL